ncbi:MAG: acetoin utilization protein AcuC [Nitrospirae bacterium]|nr:acetoin utilization protein AcuC [Nitrospirota bacterium]
MKTAFVYTEDFSKFDYGLTHPLKSFRLKLTYELIKSCGLLSLQDTKLIEPEMANEEDLLMFHEEGYINILKALNNGRMIPVAEFFGIGPGDNPVFQGMYDWSRLVTGASLKAASLVASGEVDIAFNISGGLHHAMSNYASGFCYINDPVIAIMSLLKKGYRVAYIDIDAHHGDGVQNAFYKSNKVLTISIHETGNMLFPGTGFENETGEGDGSGYSVNIPMPSGSDDALFIYAFNEIVPPIIKKFQPDIVVSQLGIDSFYNDPLAHLNYTTVGFCEAVRKIREISPKWVALGGGGYNMANVARAWTLAWVIMNEVEIPDEIPAEFLEKYSQYGFQNKDIRDKDYVEKRLQKSEMRQEVEIVISYIKKNVFPENVRSNNGKG